MAAKSLAALKSKLLISGLQRDNNPLYEIIVQLIDAAILAQTANNANSLSSLLDKAILTYSDETALLPNSRNLLAGFGIEFDDTVYGERTINGAEWSLLTDGDLLEPELIYAGGEAIMVHIP